MSGPWSGMGVRGRPRARPLGAGARSVAGLGLGGGRGEVLALGGRQDLLDGGDAFQDLPDAVLLEALEPAGQAGLVADLHRALPLEGGLADARVHLQELEEADAAAVALEPALAA